MPKTNVPVFCEHCGIINFAINVFGTAPSGGEHEMMMFAEVLLQAHQAEEHPRERYYAV